MILLPIQSLAPLNSAANPIIYSIFVPVFVETSGNYFFLLFLLMILLSIQSFAPLNSAVNPIIFCILVKGFVETSGNYFSYFFADDTYIYTEPCTT